MEGGMEEIIEFEDQLRTLYATLGVPSLLQRENWLSSVTEIGGHTEFSAVQEKEVHDRLEDAEKCLNLFTYLQHLVLSYLGQKQWEQVTSLLEQFLNGTLEVQQFSEKLASDLNSAQQPFLVPFLQKDVPMLQLLLINKKVTIEGVTSPSPAVLARDVPSVTPEQKEQFDNFLCKAVVQIQMEIDKACESRKKRLQNKKSEVRQGLKRKRTIEENTLQNLLECPVCYDEMDHTSKVLPCQHTVCLRCLSQIFASEGRLRCPECRKIVMCKPKHLPPNVLLVRLLEGMKSQADKSFTKNHEEPNSMKTCLMYLCHALKCQIMLDNGQHVCGLPKCDTYRSVLSHVTACCDGDACQVANCWTAKQAISHITKCSSSDCMICMPYRRKWAVPKRRRASATVTQTTSGMPESMQQGTRSGAPAPCTPENAEDGSGNLFTQMKGSLSESIHQTAVSNTLDPSTETGSSLPQGTAMESVPAASDQRTSTEVCTAQNCCSTGSLPKETSGEATIAPGFQECVTESNLSETLVESYACNTVSSLGSAIESNSSGTISESSVSATYCRELASGNSIENSRETSTQSGSKEACPGASLSSANGILSNSSVRNNDHKDGTAVLTNSAPEHTETKIAIDNLESSTAASDEVATPAELPQLALRQYVPSHDSTCVSPNMIQEGTDSQRDSGHVEDNKPLVQQTAETDLSVDNSHVSEESLKTDCTMALGSPTDTVPRISVLPLNAIGEELVRKCGIKLQEKQLDSYHADIKRGIQILSQALESPLLMSSNSLEDRKQEQEQSAGRQRPKLHLNIPRSNLDELQLLFPVDRASQTEPESTIPVEMAFEQSPTSPGLWSLPSTYSGPLSPVYSIPSPNYFPASPFYSLENGSPSYSQASPSYAPTSPSYIVTSPQYSPSSPVYVPTSPQYNLSSLINPSYNVTSPSNDPTSASHSPTVHNHSPRPSRPSSPSSNPESPSYSPARPRFSPTRISYSPTRPSRLQSPSSDIERPGYSPTRPRFSPTRISYSPTRPNRSSSPSSDAERPGYSPTRPRFSPTRISYSSTRPNRSSSPSSDAERPGYSPTRPRFSPTRPSMSLNPNSNLRSPGYSPSRPSFSPTNINYNPSRPSRSQSPNSNPGSPGYSPSTQF